MVVFLLQGPNFILFGYSSSMLQFGFENWLGFPLGRLANFLAFSFFDGQLCVFGTSNMV
jgi:hypothetical protein